MTTKEEAAFLMGEKAAYRRILSVALSGLGVDDAEAGKALWAAERADVIAKLRSLCADYGDNDWPDNLHIADVIEKHLFRHIYDQLDREDDQ